MPRISDKPAIAWLYNPKLFTVNSSVNTINCNE